MKAVLDWLGQNHAELVRSLARAIQTAQSLDDVKQLLR